MIHGVEVVRISKIERQENTGVYVLDITLETAEGVYSKLELNIFGDRKLHSEEVK